MIERTTGEIQLPSDGIRIGAALGREQFLASTLADECRELVRNEPHCSFALAPVQFGSHVFACSLWFHGSVLRRVSIQCADAEFGPPWSAEHELARKQFHDSLLTSVLGEEWGQRFPWGTVDSVYHSKDYRFSSIRVTYAI